MIERSSKQKTINKYSSNKARARSACGPVLPGHTRCMDYSERPHTPTGKLPPYLASAMALASSDFADPPPVKTDTATGDAAAKFKLKPHGAVYQGFHSSSGRKEKQHSRFNDQCKRYHAAKRRLAFWTRVTVAEAWRRLDSRCQTAAAMLAARAIWREGPNKFAQA